MSDPLFGFAPPRRNDHGVGHVFIGIVFALPAFDLGVLHRDQHEIAVLWLAAGYVAVAVVFGGWVWW